MLASTLLAITLVTLFAPLERTLGAGARLVYLHGAWVWSGKVLFAAAGVVGLAGLVAYPTARGVWLQRISLAFSRSALLFWWTYLPMSLWVQQINWGGIFWDEPRWRVPLMLGIVALLLQLGLSLLENGRLTALANALFGAALWYFLGTTQNVLHPDSPIFGSDATRIQFFFILLLVLSVVIGAQVTYAFYRKGK